MNAIRPFTAALTSPWEVPAPVLFNPWKHHAGFLRDRIRLLGPDALAPHLVVVGTKLMDLYTGAFAPAELADHVLTDLRATGRLEADAFRDWVAASGDYGVVPLPDGSRWVLRYGDEGGRYLHLHPARWVPETLRVRANVLKTAALALAFANVNGGDPLDLALLNAVRAQYLGLSPVGRLRDGDAGIGEVVALLRS